MCCCTGAVEVRRDLEQATGLELPSTLVFDYSSMMELVDLLLKQLPPPAALPGPAVSRAIQPSQSSQDAVSGAGTNILAAAGEAAQSSRAGPAWEPMSLMQRLAYFQQQVGIQGFAKAYLAEFRVQLVLESPGPLMRQAVAQISVLPR